MRVVGDDGEDDPAGRMRCIGVHMACAISGETLEKLIMVGEMWV